MLARMLVPLTERVPICLFVTKHHFRDDLRPCRLARSLTGVHADEELLRRQVDGLIGALARPNRYRRLRTSGTRISQAGGTPDDVRISVTSFESNERHQTGKGATFGIARP